MLLGWRPGRPVTNGTLAPPWAAAYTVGSVLAMPGAVKEPPLDSDALARLAFDAMGDKQATDLKILDLRPVTTMTDFFVIGSADSTRQIRAVAEAVEERLREEADARPIAREGEPDSGWLLIDYGPLMIHVFDPERRAYYDLETLWGEAPLVARMA